jgi:hypothetical protein
VKKRTKKKKNRNSRDYGELYQALQVEAVFNALTSNSAFFERKVRRWFSKNYNTPLLDTYAIAWDQILIHYYESALEDKTKNEIYDVAIENYLPDLMDKREEDDRAFAQELIEEQRRSIESKKQRQGKQQGKPKKEAVTDQPAKSKDVMNLNFNDEDFKEDIKE